MMAVMFLYIFVGDAVFRGPNQANITILANDEAYGIFAFIGADSKEIEEGSTATFL